MSPCQFTCLSSIIFKKQYRKDIEPPNLDGSFFTNIINYSKPNEMFKGTIYHHFMSAELIVAFYDKLKSVITTYRLST